MTHTWTQLEGASLAGDYSLRECLGGDERGAFFRSTPQGDGTQVLVKLAPDEPGSDAQLALWRRTRHLDHPNLLTLFEFGRTKIAGDQYLYGVFEYPEDRLDAALEAQGPLGEFQVREVLAALLSALRYLHAQGLVHGSLAARQVVAIGNAIKLSTDSLLESSDVEGGHLEDIRSLGALVYELLTGTRLERGRTPDVAGISEPLRTVIAHAAEPDARNRWTLAEIAAELRAHPPIPPVRVAPEPIAAVPLAAAPPAAAPITAGPIAARPAVAAPPGISTRDLSTPGMTARGMATSGMAVRGMATSSMAEKAIAEPPADADERPSGDTETRWYLRKPALAWPGLPRWIYFGVGALLLLIVVLNANRHAGPQSRPPSPVRAAGPPPKPVFHEPPPAVVQQPKAAAKQPEIAAKLPTAEKNPAPQAAEKNSAPQVAEKNPAPQAAGKTRVPEAADRAQAQQSAENNPAPQGKAIWRVIAYTYTSRSAAEKKVHEMSRRWPDLRPQVFVPAKRKDMVLVALGGRMTHEEARRLLRRAHGEGLPRDIYVQNYSE